MTLPLLHMPPQIPGPVTPHAIVFLPDTGGLEMLLCYEDEGVYVSTHGRITKDVVLQWGETPSSVGECWTPGFLPPQTPGSFLGQVLPLLDAWVLPSRTASSPWMFGSFSSPDAWVTRWSL